jgi:hypothetical protein
MEGKGSATSRAFEMKNRRGKIMIADSATNRKSDAMPNWFVWRVALFVSLGAVFTGYYDG